MVRTSHDLYNLQEDEADDDDAESESLISRVRHASSNSNSNREGEQRAAVADESVIIESPKADKDAAAPAEDSIIVLDSSSEDLLAKRRSMLYVHTVH